MNGRITCATTWISAESNCRGSASPACWRGRAASARRQFTRSRRAIAPVHALAHAADCDRAALARTRGRFGGSYMPLLSESSGAAAASEFAARPDEHFVPHEDLPRSGLRVAELPIHNNQEPWRVD